ncbi:uncharacterized protein B0T23DRAFT_452899 [Neurospora hispaniola]|uniref:Uncharacterized protein n=1 Tax=Neurospora hispaniola TaxID=588809 RepID=A0AAJ0IAE8_9PEZI|nr:hypothetical protein B0T23DRAFT_452899 [Neurospora hispaniola]
MSPVNMQAVGPFAPSVLKPRNNIIDKDEMLNRAIYRLVEEDEQLREMMEPIRFKVKEEHRWLKLGNRLKEVEKELKELRDMAAAEEKKRQAEKAAFDKQRTVEAEKKRQEEKAVAEMKRASEKAAAEQRRKDELLKRKEEEKKALQAQLATEQKRRAEADAAIKKVKEEWAASEEKKRQQLIKKADEEIQLLNAELAETKKHADLFASYERERAVEEARKKLEAAKRRLKLEYDEWRRKSYEAWKVQDRERQKVEEENLRRDARKKKEASDARKKAEQQTSSAQRPKEVSFDIPRNQTYDNRSAPKTYQRPEQHDVRHADKGTHQRDHHASHSHFHPQNGQPDFHPRDASRPKDSVPEQHLSSPHYPKYHHEGVHPPTFGVSPRNQKAPVGLSGMPAGSSTASQFPAAAPWEEKNWSSNNYPAADGAWEHSHRNVPSQNPSSTERKWSTPKVSTWKGPAQESKAMDENHFISPAHVTRLESPKEKWPLPPSPRISNESKGWDVPSDQLQETEENKLRREVEEYKTKCAKLAADLERKRRVTGADSVATWQTGTKSIWEDPTKPTSLSSPKDTPKDTNYAPQGHQSDAPWTQTAKSSSSRHNERNSQRDNKGIGSFKESSKPTFNASNPHSQQPSTSKHYSSKSRPEPVDRKSERPGSRASIETRYFEAEEYRDSDNDTPKPKFSNRDTQFKWQKASVESAQPYVPPTPHRCPSPPPILPPTPPRGSRISTPATLKLAPKSRAAFRQEIQTPKLTDIPGSWRDDLPNKNSNENRWPANVSTPSVKNLPVAVKPKDKFKPERYIPPTYAPKDVPPPGSYLSTDTRYQQPGYGHPLTPYYGNLAAIPQPGPAYPIHHPLYAPNVQTLTHSMDVEAGPSGHGGQFASWADQTAAQSLGVIQAPPRKDKGKGRAR